MSDTNEVTIPATAAEPAKRGRPTGTRKPSGEAKKKRNPAAEALQAKIDTALKLLKRACGDDNKADFGLVAVTIDILEAE